MSYFNVTHFYIVVTLVESYFFTQFTLKSGQLIVKINFFAEPLNVKGAIIFIIARVFCGFTLLNCAKCYAETLQEAVLYAYETNPSLLAQRAQLRALDETYVQARAGWRPTVGVQGEVVTTRESTGSGQGAQLLQGAGGNLVIVPPQGVLTSSTGDATLVISQPLYTGGRVATAVSAAEADVFGGRAALRKVEIQVMQTVADAYIDVLRDQEAVGVRRENLVVLQQQVDEVVARIELGQATQVDLAQARAQLANARSQLSSAQGQLQISSAAYAAVVGRPPASLDSNPKLPALPADMDAAFTAAENENPSLQQARFGEQGARFRVAEARASSRPTVNAQVSVGYTGASALLAARDYNSIISGTVSLNQPIYSGGVGSSQIRQALEQENESRAATESSRRAVIQTVSQAWSAMETAQANVDSNAEQVGAAKLAFEGLQEQHRFGTASMIDFLIQEQQYRDAQLALLQAQHDLFTSRAAVLAAVGSLTAAHIAPATPVYDPEQSFRRVNRSSQLPLEAAPQLLDRIDAPPR